jgi:hypothetical protein
MARLYIAVSTYLLASAFIILIALLEQLSRYTGINYATVIGNVLAYFKVTKESISYFITNNARNNNTCLDYLATVFNFRKDN